MIILSAAYVSAPLSTMLSQARRIAACLPAPLAFANPVTLVPVTLVRVQGVIPISMLLSWKWLGRKFKTVHYVGAFIIMGSLTFTIINTRYVFCCGLFWPEVL